MKQPVLLFTSAGRRNQLIQCFREDARALGLDLTVLAADLCPELSPACHEADTAFRVPRCTSEEYVPALLALCREQSVSLLVPTIDPELSVLARHVADFSAIGTRVLISEPDVVQLGNDKLATARCLAKAGIPTPKTVTLAEYRLDRNCINGPVIAKPNAGSASVGIVRPRSAADLDGVPDAGYIVQELWSGAEFTVNVFFDQKGCLQAAVPHRRLEVRGGEVSKGRTERLPQLVDAAAKLGNALAGARGPLCFQAIVRADGEFCVFEINARFGGGYPLAHRAGAAFSLWLLEEISGLASSAGNHWKDGVTMLRYDSAVFIND
jgi:carbamoyl-phosphate synthase large subunit